MSHVLPWEGFSSALSEQNMLTLIDFQWKEIILFLFYLKFLLEKAAYFYLTGFLNILTYIIIYIEYVII